MRYVNVRPLAPVAVGFLLCAGSASAQYDWGHAPTPSSGACFYEDINYGGRYFCARLGEERGRVPTGTNDEISSIRLFGSTEVIVFSANDMRGDSRRFTSSIRDLRQAGFNDRVSSFVVERRSSGGNWGGAYGGGNWGSGSEGYSGGYGGSYYGGAYGAGSHGKSHSGGRWTYQEAQDIVRRAYRSVLQRDPDPAAASWVNEVMKNNWSQRQLEAELRKSPEYLSKHGR